MIKTDFYSADPLDYVRAALAIETLAYLDKNYLSSDLKDNAKISKEVQVLLAAGIRGLENKE